VLQNFGVLRGLGLLALSWGKGKGKGKGEGGRGKGEGEEGGDTSNRGIASGFEVQRKRKKNFNVHNFRKFLNTPLHFRYSLQNIRNLLESF
jgi:hypothetical protein